MPAALTAPTQAAPKKAGKAAGGKKKTSAAAPGTASEQSSPSATSVGTAAAAPKTAAKSVRASKAKTGKGARGNSGKPSKHAEPDPDPAPTEPPTTTPTPTTKPPTAVVATTPTAPAATAPAAGPTSRPAGSERTRGRRRAAARRGAGSAAPPSTSTGTTPSLLSGTTAPLAVAQGTPAGAGDGERAARERKSEDPAGEQERGSPVTRTVRDIVEVVPYSLKVALAGLFALSVVLGGGYLLAEARARRLVRQRAGLLQDVGLLQTALLPSVPATVGAMRTSVAYRPSDGPGAGGDFYDALTLPGGRAAFILGDVSGHGRQALARTAFIRYTLRAYIEAGLEPRLALQLASPVIGEHLGGDFATVVLAIHDPRNGSLTYACAGHPAPIVVGPTRPEPVVAASSLPIGLAMRTGVRQTTLPLPPGSVVCLYTDGLAEARTQRGILGRPRLADMLEELGREATAPALLERVADEARLVTDDMATVVLIPTAGVTAGGFREERLETDVKELDNGLAERFLRACGLDDSQVESAISEGRAWAEGHGAVVLHVRFGIRGPMVEVLPRNVESLEAASRRRAALA